MKNFKHIVLSSAAVAAMLASGSAYADVLLNWDVDKSKRIDIDIVVAKFKFAEVQVIYDKDLEGAAEAHAFGNQWNGFNRVSYVGDEGPLGPSEGDTAGPGVPENMVIRKTSETTDSFNNNEGIMQANQDAGNMVNQGNAASISLTAANPDNQGTDIQGTFAHSEAFADQINVFNQTYHHELNPLTGGAQTVDDVIDVAPGDLPTEVPGFLNANIDNSFNGNMGVLHFNQNTGNTNNQYNALAAAIGDDAAYALADAGIAQVNAFNVVDDQNTIKYDDIRGSFSNNTGTIAVNQATGHHNNQATVVSVAAISSLAGVGVGTGN